MSTQRSGGGGGSRRGMPEPLWKQVHGQLRGLVDHGPDWIEFAGKQAAGCVAGRLVFRSLCWRVFLGILDPKASCVGDWCVSLQGQREAYIALLQDLEIDPHVLERRSAGAWPVRSTGKTLPSRADGNFASVHVGKDLSSLHERIVTGGMAKKPGHAAVCDDHPLSLNEDSIWYRTLVDGMADRQQIRLDLNRTFVQHEIFSDSAVQEIMMRVLTVWCMSHNHGQYWQGMSHLLAAIYHAVVQDVKLIRLLCSSGPIDGDLERVGEKLFGVHSVEADVYGLFAGLMLRMLPMYRLMNAPETLALADATVASVTSLGPVSSSNGSASRSGNMLMDFWVMLRARDPDLFSHLEGLGVAPHLFAIRWVLLLLAREFEFRRLMQVWDMVFADSRGTGRFDIFPYVCVALVLSIRAQLLACSDLGECVMLLQTSVPRATSCKPVLSLALDLRACSGPFIMVDAMRMRVFGENSERQNDFESLSDSTSVATPTDPIIVSGGADGGSPSPWKSFTDILSVQHTDTTGVEYRGAGKLLRRVPLEESGAKDGLVGSPSSDFGGVGERIASVESDLGGSWGLVHGPTELVQGGFQRHNNHDCTPVSDLGQSQMRSGVSLRIGYSPKETQALVDMGSADDNNGSSRIVLRTDDGSFEEVAIECIGIDKLRFTDEPTRDETSADDIDQAAQIAGDAADCECEKEGLSIRGPKLSRGASLAVSRRARSWLARRRSSVSRHPRKRVDEGIPNDHGRKAFI